LEGEFEEVKDLNVIFNWGREGAGEHNKRGKERNKMAFSANQKELF